MKNACLIAFAVYSAFTASAQFANLDGDPVWDSYIRKLLAFKKVKEITSIEFNEHALNDTEWLNICRFDTSGELLEEKNYDNKELRMLESVNFTRPHQPLSDSTWEYNTPGSIDSIKLMMALNYRYDSSERMKARYWTDPDVMDSVHFFYNETGSLVARSHFSHGKISWADTLFYDRNKLLVKEQMEKRDGGPYRRSEDYMDYDDKGRVIKRRNYTVTNPDSIFFGSEDDPGKWAQPCVYYKTFFPVLECVVTYSYDKKGGLCLVVQENYEKGIWHSRYEKRLQYGRSGLPVCLCEKRINRRSTNVSNVKLEYRFR